MKKVVSGGTYIALNPLCTQVPHGWLYNVRRDVAQPAGRDGPKAYVLKPCWNLKPPNVQ
jgi:hypothetical protein